MDAMDADELDKRMALISKMMDFDEEELNEIIYIYRRRMHPKEKPALDEFDEIPARICNDLNFYLTRFHKVKIFDRKKNNFNSQNRNIGDYSSIRRAELLDLLPEYVYLTGNSIKSELERARNVWKDKVVGLDDILEKILLHIITYIKTGHTRPLLFVGVPGCGKTTVSRAYSEMLNLESFYVNAPRMATSRGLYGDAGTYRDADCGAVAEAMIMTKTGNPVIILDEIDKASASISGGLCKLQDEALNLLDESAEMFKDNFLQVSFNASYCPIVLTANELDRITPTLADRCEIVRFPECTREHIARVCNQQIIPALLEKLACENEVMIEQGLVEETVVEMFKLGYSSIRAYQSVFENAISSAYLRAITKEQKQGVCRNDIRTALNNTQASQKRKVGFA